MLSVAVEEPGRLPDGEGLRQGRFARIPAPLAVLMVLAV